MTYQPPRPLELTELEATLFVKIPQDPTHDGWKEVADAMERLALSLFARDAVPEIRLRLFSDPNYAEVGNKSRMQVFESNGTAGNDIFRHPNFIPYLNHFIHQNYPPLQLMDYARF
jgi:hypothetical protein